MVDDRAGGTDLWPLVPDALRGCTHIASGQGAGPAAARNVGWRLADSEWIAFLDDDVEPSAQWRVWLAKDLAKDIDTPASVAGVQGMLTVPLPATQPPTDWERSVAGLAGARWATADMAYRRHVLAAVGVSTNDSRGPTGRMPTSPSGSGAPATGWLSGSAGAPIRCGPRTPGSACVPNAATPTTR